MIINGDESLRSPIHGSTVFGNQYWIREATASNLAYLR